VPAGKLLTREGMMPEQLVVVRQGAVQVTGGTLPGAWVLFYVGFLFQLTSGEALYAPVPVCGVGCVRGMHSCRQVNRCVAWMRHEGADGLHVEGVFKLCQRSGCAGLVLFVLSCSAH
jgi:hypothetical protein